MLLRSLFVCLCLIQLIAAFQINPSSFQKEVVEDERIWLVKFYSSLCASCKEFNPVWEKITSGAKYFRYGEIDIDMPEGEELAKSLGIMDEGIPNVRMFVKPHDKKGELIFAGGNHPRAHEIIGVIRKVLAGHEKDEKGTFLKGATPK